MKYQPVKLHIKKYGNIHILQLRRQFNRLTIFLALFILAILPITIFTISSIILEVIASLLYLSIFIYHVAPIMKTVLFGEKVVWAPGTKELVVKSSKYKIGSSSFIGFSEEEKIVRHKKMHSFHFELIESEQNQSIPLFPEFKFAHSEVRKFVEIGEQLSLLFEVPFKMPSFARTEVRNSKKMVDGYLGKLQSDLEFISPPPNTFVSAQMLDTLTLPEKLSYCFTLSEKPATIKLTFKGAAKKTNLRTLIGLAFIIIVMFLPHFVFVVIVPHLLSALLWVFITLFDIAGILLIIHFIYLMLLHYGIEKKNQGSLTIGHRNVTIIRQFLPTEKTFTFSLDKIQGIDVVLTTTQEFTIKFQDTQSVTYFGIFEKEEAEQLKSFIDMIICKQYHENRFVQSEAQDSTDINDAFEDNLSETSKTKHAKSVDTQSR